MFDPDQLDALAAAWVAQHHIPALALAVVREGAVAHIAGFGVTSVEDGGIPVTPDTIFRIASTTKLLVGTAILRLVEAGTLDLDAPVATYLPWFRFSQPGLERIITLRHLLSHTSGLCTFRMDLMSREPSGLERFIREHLPTYSLLAPPGTVWLYSNAGLSLAAFIAQSVTGTPFWDLMRALVFHPLDMPHTTFDPLVAMTYPFAQAHLRDADSALRVDHTFPQSTAWDPAGGAMSTAHDLAHLAAMYLSDGHFAGQTILTPETVRLMQSPLVRTWTLDDGGYGLTFATETYKGVPLVRHHGGSVASYGCCFTLAPDRGVGIALLANGGPLLPLLRQLLDLLLDLPADVAPPPAAAPDRALWPAYTGTYLGIYTGLVDLRAQDDHLLLVRNGREFVLEVRETRLYAGRAVDGEETIAVGLVPTAPGATPYLAVDDSPCERVTPIAPIAPDSALWRTFTGTYRLPGGSLMPGLPLTVTLDGDTLRIARGGASMPCLPLDATHFACDLGLLAFQPAPGGPTLEVWRTMIARRTAP
jgi:CubicO group peptidase (beta-lactamase class C family)